MKEIAICVAMVFLSAMVQAEELAVTVDGKEIKMNSTTIQHEVKDTDRDKGSQASAMACSFRYYDLLSKGDIQGAAGLTTDPASAVDRWTKYRERVGEKEFKKIMGDYFTSKNVILAEITLNEDIMLVIKSEDGPMAQFYRNMDGKYLISYKPAAAKTFGEVLSMIQEGKMKQWSEPQAVPEPMAR